MACHLPKATPDRLRAYLIKWANLASHNAGVTVVIIGIATDYERVPVIYSIGEDGETIAKSVDKINSYLVPGRGIDISPSRVSLSGCAYMDLGNMPKRRRKSPDDRL